MTNICILDMMTGLINQERLNYDFHFDQKDVNPCISRISLFQRQHVTIVENTFANVLLFFIKLSHIPSLFKKGLR